MSIHKTADLIINVLKETPPQLLDTVGKEKVMDIIEDYIMEFIDELNEQTRKDEEEYSNMLLEGPLRDETALDDLYAEKAEEEINNTKTCKDKK